MYWNVILAAGLGCGLLYYMIRMGVLTALKEYQMLYQGEKTDLAVSETLSRCLEKECQIILTKECRFGSSFQKEIEGKVISIDPAWVGIVYEGEDCQAGMNIIRISYIQSILVAGSDQTEN